MNDDTWEQLDDALSSRTAVVVEADDPMLLLDPKSFDIWIRVVTSQAQAIPVFAGVLSYEKGDASVGFRHFLLFNAPGHAQRFIDFVNREQPAPFRSASICLDLMPLEQSG